MVTPKIKTAAIGVATMLLASCGGASEQQTHEAQLAEMRAQFTDIIAKARQTQGEGKPPVWTLSDEDTNIHIFGTYHILPPHADWRTETFDAAFAEAHTLYTEADTNSAEAQAKFVEFFAEMTAKERPAFKEVLTDFEYEIVERAAKDVGIPIASLEVMDMNWAGMMLSIGDSYNRGYSDELGVESILESEARERGMKLGYLESVDFQIGLLTEIGGEDEVEMLVMTAASIEEGGEFGDLLLEEWLDGDVAGVGATMSPDVFGSQDAYDAMLTDRNRNWVPQIEAMLDEPGTIMVAVGAGHLAGPDSVILMLRDKGYTVDGP